MICIPEINAYLATLRVDLVNRLHGIQVIDTRVKTDLVHYDDASFACSCIKFGHRRGDVARRHNVSLTFNGGFNDGSMISVRDKRDDQIVGRYFGLESGCVAHV